MVGRAGALVEVPSQPFGCPGVERSDDPVALVTVDLGRGEGLSATLAAQLATTRRSKVANPVRDPIVRQEIPGPVDLDRDQGDVEWRARAPAPDLEGGGDPDP